MKCPNCSYKRGVLKLDKTGYYHNFTCKGCRFDFILVLDDSIEFQSQVDRMYMKICEFLDPDLFDRISTDMKNRIVN